MFKLFNQPIVVIAFILLALWIGYLFHPNESVGFVNMKEVINMPIKEIASKMDKAHQGAFIDAYNAHLAKTLEDYALNHHINLVTATTLYNYSGVDVTREIIKANLSQMEAK